jgi:hypothetical protein
MVRKAERAIRSVLEQRFHAKPITAFFAGIQNGRATFNSPWGHREIALDDLAEFLGQCEFIDWTLPPSNVSDAAGPSAHQGHASMLEGLAPSVVAPALPRVSRAGRIARRLRIAALQPLEFMHMIHYRVTCMRESLGARWGA